MQCKGLGAGYSVCAKTEPEHLSLSLSEYNPFHSLQGRAANEPALSLPRSLYFPLVLYLSFAHEPRAELPSPCLHLAEDKPEWQRALLPLMTLSHLSPLLFSTPPLKVFTTPRHPRSFVSQCLLWVIRPPPQPCYLDMHVCCLYKHLGRDNTSVSFRHRQ